MEAKEKIINVLNDLIRINNDRIEGYEKAADEIRDTANADMKTIFFQYAEESRMFKEDLQNAVLRLGGEPAKATTASGKIYRAWMDVKAAFAGNDVKAALESCEFGEDAALRAYRVAGEEELKNGAWPAEIVSLISNQRQSLQRAHDRIKQYRDEFRAVDTH